MNVPPELQTIYNFVITNPWSAVYTRLYSEQSEMKKLTQEHWESLPYITREMLTTIPFWDRVFTHPSEVDVIKATSGTSARAPFIFPRHLSFPYAVWKESFQLTEVTGLLTFQQHSYHLRCSRQEGETFPVIQGDIQHPLTSLRYAEQVGVNCMLIISHGFEVIRPHFAHTRLGNSLKYILTAGERLTPEYLHSLQTLFPNATIHPIYGLSELEGLVGIQKDKSYPLNIFSPAPYHYWELIDENGRAIHTEHTPGELVITSLVHPHLTLPLVRYRTNDRAVIRKIGDTNQNNQYEILGRMEYDFIKIPGGQLLTTAIENSLRFIDPALTEDYQIVAQTNTSAKTPRLQLTLRLPRQRFLSTCVSEAEFLTRFETQLQVNPHRSYAEGVEHDLYEPFNLDYSVDDLFPTGHKRLKLIKK